MFRVAKITFDSRRVIDSSLARILHRNYVGLLAQSSASMSADAVETREARREQVKLIRKAAQELWSERGDI